MLRVRPLLGWLESAYGPQRWWPADTRFEIIVGALLVQRTTWRNAEAAIANLRDRDLLRCEALASVALGDLEGLVRQAGFYRMKAARLLALARYFSETGGVDGLDGLEDAALRTALLSLPGVGEETADAVALYAYRRPVWISDAYSRRLLARLAGRPFSRSDERKYVGPLVRARDTHALGELHALVVEHCKRVCMTAPRCDACGLRRRCAAARNGRGILAGRRRTTSAR